jgi:hypothetical protein
VDGLRIWDTAEPAAIVAFPIASGVN